MSETNTPNYLSSDEEDEALEEDEEEEWPPRRSLKEAFKLRKTRVYVGKEHHNEEEEEKPKEPSGPVYWITVHGFPYEAADHVVSSCFIRFGQILEKRWQRHRLQLRYRTRWELERAISHDCKRIDQFFVKVYPTPDCELAENLTGQHFVANNAFDCPLNVPMPSRIEYTWRTYPKMFVENTSSFFYRFKAVLSHILFNTNLYEMPIVKDTSEIPLASYNGNPHMGIKF